MSRVVEANEPNTVNYRFYFDRNETKCVVQRIGKFEAYGNPSKKLQKVLTSFSPETYNLFTGFTR